MLERSYFQNKWTADAVGSSAWFHKSDNSICSQDLLPFLSDQMRRPLSTRAHNLQVLIEYFTTKEKLAWSDQ